MPWWKFWERSAPDNAKITSRARAVETYRDPEAAEATGDFEEHYEAALALWLAGYEAEAAIHERIAADLESDEEHPLTDEIRTTLATKLVARARAEAERRAEAFPAVTDNDKLSAAFAALERRGIVARENFTCCLTCGSAEIAEELDAAGDAGASVRGYVFFHLQDTEGAVESGSVMLAFGAVEEGDEHTTAIGREACEVLHEHGLETSWNGTAQRRILVALTWQRRPAAGYPAPTLLAR